MRLHVPPSLLLATAAATVGFGAIFALLPDFQKNLGFSDGWLGVVTAASFVAGFGSQMGLARFADRGHGRALLVGGIAVSAIGLFGVALADSVGVLVVARVVLGLGEGAFLPAARRIVIVRNPDAIGSALGRLGAAGTGGFLIGPPLAAFIAERWSLKTPFVVIGVLLVASLPFVARFPVPAAAEVVSIAPIRALLRSRGVRAGLCLGASLTVAIGVYDSLWAKFLKDDHGASTNFVAWSLLVFAMPMVALASRMGRAADRVGAVRLGSWCAIASAPLIAAYGFLPNAWLIGVFALLHSTLDSAVTPSSQAAVARSSPPELLAAGQGLLDGSGLLVAAASAVVFSRVYERFGPPVLWCALAACVALAGLGAQLVDQKTRRASGESRSRRDIARSTAKSP